MAYTIKRTDGTTLAVIADGSANTATDLTLIGKNYLNYGTALNENLIKLLESFANTSAPSKPVRGQIWYDTANSDVKVYNGTSWVFTSTKANTFTASGTITGGNLDTAGNLNVTVNANVGNLSSSGIVTATGNVTGGNLTTAGALSVTGNANVGNVGTGIVIATGNVTGANINTAGTVTASRLISNVATGTSPLVVSSSTQVANLNAQYSGNSVTANTVVDASQPNITSVGTLTSLTVSGTSTLGAIANVKVTGGTSGQFVTTDGTGNLSFTTISAGSTIVNGNSNVVVAANSNVTVNVTAANSYTFATSSFAPNGNGAQQLGLTTNRWSNIWGVSSSAQYADLAEKYHADDVYIPGTVMCLGGSNEVTKSTKDLDDRVFGVISTNPAYLMNDNNEHPLWVPIVLTGRANVMVTGTVSKGDWLVSAGDGTARAAGPGEVQFNLVIGRSLMNKTINTPALVEAYISTK